MTNMKFHTLSIGTKMDDLWYPWTDINSNFPEFCVIS